MYSSFIFTTFIYYEQSSEHQVETGGGRKEERGGVFRSV